jgi:glycosyltransferase involved in cell wall biosynthesis
VKIALDTNSLYVSRAGTTRYVSGLLTGFRRLASPELTVRAIAWEVENYDYAQPMRAAKTLYRELVWAQLVAPRVLRSNSADLLHRCGLMEIAKPRGCREVVTVHDMAFRRHPERYRYWSRISAPHYAARLERADHLIAVSSFTADEYMRFNPGSSRKITVIHHGIFDVPEPVRRNGPQLISLPTDYFLFVGSIEPGKNLSLLKEAYLLAKDRGLRLPPLVLVGVKWAGVHQDAIYPSDWILLGYQPDDVVAHAYRNARALLFPSKYEGFGLPVVEAMAAGCPVVCSRVASLPEVAGTAALFADMSPHSYLQAMQELVTNDGLRAEYGERGKEHAKQFSWERCASQTAEVYRHVAG